MTHLQIKMRPARTDHTELTNKPPDNIEQRLQADFSKAKKLLGWQPKVTFKELVIEMVEADIKFVNEAGY